MEYKDEREKIKKEITELKKAYESVFINNPDGDIVLIDMLNELGFFATDPREINPELIGFANKLLMRCGVYSSGAGLQRYIDCMRRSAKGE